MEEEVRIVENLGGEMDMHEYLEKLDTELGNPNHNRGLGNAIKFVRHFAESWARCRSPTPWCWRRSWRWSRGTAGRR